MDLSEVAWRKASYSGDNGGACVEVGVWRKASYSGDDGGGCIEVGATTASQVAVRDSKDPDGPALTFTAPTWREFINRGVPQD